MGKKRIKEFKEAEAQEGGAKVAVKTKKQVHVKRGNFFINSTYNNTFVAFTDEDGRVLAVKSAGQAGFKGTKKSTPFAASKVVEAVLADLDNIQVEEAHVFIKGVGAGRDSALRTIMNRSLNVVEIRDVTPVPFNGPRPRKVRRV